MRQRCPSAFVPAKRNGSVSVETLILLPVFLVLLLGFIEISLIVIVEQRLAAASFQGARVASQGGTAADVVAAVDTSLGPGTLQSNITVTISDPNGPTTHPQSDASGVPLTVLVQVDATAVIPDLLRFIGYSLSSQVLAGQTTMRKE
jgi:Flp pilus assembly protein TadG